MTHVVCFGDCVQAVKRMNNTIAYLIRYRVVLMSHHIAMLWRLRTGIMVGLYCCLFWSPLVT